MNGYRVSFYKDLLNSDGHNFKCLQRQIDVVSDDPSQARVLAEQQIGNKCLNIDCVEVVHLVDDLEGFEHPPRPRKHSLSPISTPDDMA